MKLLLATVSAATLLIASPVLAADINGGSFKDGPVASSSSGVNWTGFYLGGQVGYGISSAEITTRSTQDFAAVPSRCWANLGFNSTNADWINDINIGSPDDERDHVVEAGVNASITNVTEEECTEIREELNLIGQNAPQIPPGTGATLDSGYDAAVAAHSVTTTQTGKTSESGILGGARVGYDQQLGRVLVGVFGDYNFSGIDGLDNQWLVAGRAGVIVAPRTLVYGLVGYGQSDYDGVDFSGLVAGGGIEFAATDSLFLGLEYQHAFYGNETLVNTPNLKIDADVEKDRILATAKIKFGGERRGNILD